VINHYNTFQPATGYLPGHHMIMISHRAQVSTAVGMGERTRHYGATGRGICMYVYLYVCMCVIHFTTPPFVSYIYRYYFLFFIFICIFVLIS
jgi:hypothetical protein